MYKKLLKKFNDELDELRTISREGKGWIARLEQEERERTDIPTLKVKYNKVFGYYLEVSKANLERVPEDYERKQTLVNAERFVTDELERWEGVVLRGREQAAGAEAVVIAVAVAISGVGDPG